MFTHYAGISISTGPFVNIPEQGCLSVMDTSFLLDPEG
jgi:hypothetical protein